MFYNIFKKRKQGLISNRKPTILADIHEKDSLILANLTELGAELHITNLKVGDYLINNTLIERKTFSDFISSMLSKRLIEQLKNMLQYPKKLLIIEGTQKLPENSKLNLNSIKGLILSISLDFQIPIIQTKNEQETSDYLFLLAKRQLKPQQELSLHSRIPKTKQEQKQYILESFPNIGPKTAKKLLKEFKTLKQIFNSQEEVLKPILKSRSSQFKEILET